MVLEARKVDTPGRDWKRAPGGWSGGWVMLRSFTRVPATQLSPFVEIQGVYMESGHTLLCKYVLT